MIAPFGVHFDADGNERKRCLSWRFPNQFNLPAISQVIANIQRVKYNGGDMGCKDRILSGVTPCSMRLSRAAKYSDSRL